LFSQEENRPKVGLVLSGGCQRFCAYRVLKVLEEAGLKIDYIENKYGVSCWGLYASGYTASQIDSIFKLQILMN
jgi:NTE family protein